MCNCKDTEEGGGGGGGGYGCDVCDSKGMEGCVYRGGLCNSKDTEEGMWG